MIGKITRKLKRIPEQYQAKKYRDSIILFNMNRKALPNEVNLHWYSMMREDGKENLGDYLSVPLFEYMLARKNINPHKKLSSTKHLYMVGSILFFGYQHATVWGSGCLMKPHVIVKLSNSIKLDIRAVRGPETRKVLLEQGYDCPEIYGDPAILMPLVYQPKIPSQKQPYSVILHKSAPKSVANQIDIVTKDYKKFIDKIVSSERIVSTSLHGIILAESYGIPAVLLSDDREDFSLFKYNDYYYSTGRKQYPVAKTIEEALDIEPARLPDLESMREKLLDVFPYDLWAVKE